MKFYSPFLIFASLAVSSYASTVADVLADISTISGQLTTIDTTITNFDGSISEALEISSQAQDLESSINKGTTDATEVTPTPFSEADGNTVLSAVQGVAPTFLDTLQEIVIKKPLFDGLPIPNAAALVEQALTTLNASVFAFEAALIAATPTDLVPTATAIKTTVDAALASAISVYSTF